MTFWDHIKPAERPPQATAVDLSPDQQVLTLTWDDGQKTQVTARALRQGCPCAGCVDEWTHQRTLDPEKVPQDLRALSMRAVGNYAVAFQFSDAHQTGIYHWTLLRQLSRPA
ncbi:MAG TPA: DUF971 domain-containing protein [Myxococcaceae bacterium]|nr:DUF971 domain-containing protein [Myxococcaceae bacterium]